MFPMNHKPFPVAVEYTAHGQRVVRQFANAYQARQFYVAKNKVGAQPKVIATTEITAMAKNTTANTTTTPKAPKAEKANKPAKAEKVTPVTEISSNGKGEHGVMRSHDLPWNPKKIAIFKALKAMKATSDQAAVTGKDVAAKAGVKPVDVRHYCYHAMAAGLISLAKIDGVAGYSFYLTAKGLAVDLTKEAKEYASKKKAN